MKRSPVVILLFILSATATVLAGVMDFETAGAWKSAPDLLQHFEEDELVLTKHTTYKALATGITPSDEFVKQGEYSGRWADHPRFPTIHATDVPENFSLADGMSVWIYSEAATGERVTLAILSDGEETRWRDFYLHTFVVNWTGWKQLRIPFSAFETYEQPAGWDQVGRIYFFTRIFNRQPNPYTVLYLDDMRLEAKITDPQLLAPAPEEDDIPLPYETEVPDFDPTFLNHSYPEVRPGEQVEVPIQYMPYFQAERALFGYYPRFQPGPVSFSPEGTPYIQYAGFIIETVDEEGQWHYTNLLKEVIEPYARKELDFEVLKINGRGQGNETAIRFDGDGDAYMLVSISDATGDWKTRTGLLLHSTDGMKTWDVYPLPKRTDTEHDVRFYMARFEKYAGHNEDRLNRPPVILLSVYHAPTTTYITVPEKGSDGTLDIPGPVKIAEEAMPFIPHSGEANQAITHDGKVYITYGQVKILPGHSKEEGAPAYAVVYDIESRTLSEPVLIGFGGRNAEDAHNWPALAVDSEGILHVVINGHHDPFRYTHSKRPWDISEWTEPVEVAQGTSYAGLVCDSNDVLYTVTRNSHPGYYFRLSMHRKQPGEPWEEPQHLTIPYKPYYKIWYHKLTIDPATDRLFLSYFSQSGSICVFKDSYLAYIYTWPDREKNFLNTEDSPIPQGTCFVEPRKYEFYQPPPSEMTTLVSGDGGDSWHLATTPDFE